MYPIEIVKKKKLRFWCYINRPLPSCFEPIYESEAKCKVFVIKISFHSYANKSNFCTYPRFHSEVHSNSEMAYCHCNKVL